MPKAIRITETGGPDVMRWEDVEVGEPGEGQARIRHTAVGVNLIDTYHRSGLYPLPLPAGSGARPLESLRQSAPVSRSSNPAIVWPMEAVRPAHTPRVA